MSIIIKNVQLAGPEGLKKADILICGGQIAAVGDLSEAFILIIYFLILNKNIE